MPAIAESPEAETLAQAAKKFFQPPPEPREVVHAPKETAPPAKESAAKEPAPKAATKESKVDPTADDAATKQTPKSEDDEVFGTLPTKPSKVVEAPKDDDFEKSLAEEKKDMPEKAGTKWEQLRRSEKAARDEAKAAREELKAAAESSQSEKQSDATPKIEALTNENAALKLQLAEAEKTLSVTQVERSQKYRREIAEPMGELTKTAEDMAGRYEVSPKSILEALSAEPKERAEKLSELAADFNEADRIELYTIAKDMDRLRRNGEKLRDKAKTDLSALEQEEREAEERDSAERAATFSASAQRTWDEASQSLEFLRHHAAAPDWNAALDTARAESASYVAGRDPIADGRMIAEAIQSRFIRKWGEHLKTKLAAITEERDQLLARIEADNAHDPGLAGSRDAAGDATDESNEDLSLGQRVKASMGRGR